MDGTLVKVLSWYDNEWGFSNRMLDMTLAMVKAELGFSCRSKRRDFIRMPGAKPENPMLLSSVFLA